MFIFVPVFSGAKIRLSLNAETRWKLNLTISTRNYSLKFKWLSGLEISLVGHGLPKNGAEVGESRSIRLEIEAEASFQLEAGTDGNPNSSVCTVLWMDKGLNIHQVNKLISTFYWFNVNHVNIVPWSIFLDLCRIYSP